MQEDNITVGHIKGTEIMPNDSNLVVQNVLSLWALKLQDGCYYHGKSKQCNPSIMVSKTNVGVPAINMFVTLLPTVRLSPEVTRSKVTVIFSSSFSIFWSERMVTCAHISAPSLEPAANVRDTESDSRSPSLMIAEINQ